MDPDQTAHIEAVCSGSTLFASLLNSSVMLGNYLQQTTSADDIFRCIFFHGVLRVINVFTPKESSNAYTLFVHFLKQLNFEFKHILENIRTMSSGNTIQLLTSMR